MVEVIVGVLGTGVLTIIGYCGARIVRSIDAGKESVNNMSLQLTTVATEFIGFKEYVKDQLAQNREDIQALSARIPVSKKPRS